MRARMAKRVGIGRVSGGLGVEWPLKMNSGDRNVIAGRKKEKGRAGLQSGVSP